MPPKMPGASRVAAGLRFASCPRLTFGQPLTHLEIIEEGRTNLNLDISPQTQRFILSHRELTQSLGNRRIPIIRVRADTEERLVKMRGPVGSSAPEWMRPLRQPMSHRCVSGRESEAARYQPS